VQYVIEITQISSFEFDFEILRACGKIQLPCGKVLLHQMPLKQSWKKICQLKEYFQLKNM